MKIIVKSVIGASASVEVDENTKISDVKKRVENDINIPAGQQTLVLMGKPLQDDKTVGDYPKIKDGTKLFAALKKQETLNLVLNRFLRRYYTEDQCKLIVDEFMKDFHVKLANLSLDDLERLAKADMDACI